MKVVTYKVGKKEFLGFKRVSYAEGNTPKELQEFSLEGVPASPVGTRREIQEFMKQQGQRYAGVALVDYVKKVKFIEFVPTEDLGKGGEDGSRSHREG